MHGLRHTFRTIADERLNLDRIILEVILGHNIGTKMDAVYNRSMYMDQKMAILTQWNDWIDS
jgi:integrase